MRPDDLPDNSGRRNPRPLGYGERSNSHQHETGPGQDQADPVQLTMVVVVPPTEA
jgi:hypothetical protein